jgi:hypothetical protein
MNNRRALKEGEHMDRRISILALVVVLSLAGACAKTEKADPAEAAWSEYTEAWSEAETAEDKTRLAEEYLAKFPNTEHSGRLARRIIYYRGQEMDDPQGAFDAIHGVLDQIEDPEQRFVASMSLFDLADSVEIPLEIGDVANALEAERPLSYDEHQWVFETATELELWPLAAKHAGAATEIATPENLRADYPDREFSILQTEQMVGLRKATSLTYEGWAAFKTGDTELAFDRFAAADAAESVNYLGVPKTPLYSFWGRAALAEGDIDRAIELLGAETLFSEDGSDEEPFLREAYAAKNGDDEGFDEFLWATRNELSKKADDFTLLDYDGNEVSMAETSAGKVTLLAFWFPT